MTRDCGCDTIDDHVEPYHDNEWGHGERSDYDMDEGMTGPIEVPGSRPDYGTFRGMPDAYCFCGHPNYMTCYAWLGLTPEGELKSA